MDSENKKKIVWFNIYCEKCTFKETAETDEPCNECLTNTANVASHKPVNFKEKE